MKTAFNINTDGERFFTVELYMYSGMPNPSVLMTQDSLDAWLKPLYSKMMVTTAPEEATFYFGTCVIRSMGPDDGEVVDTITIIPKVKDGALTIWVLQPSAGDKWAKYTLTDPKEYITWIGLTGPFKEESHYVQEVIQKQQGKGHTGHTADEPGIIPFFTREEDYWNFHPPQPPTLLTARMNNCYNYAADVRTYTYAQPGRAQGLVLRQANIMEDTRLGAQMDGMVPVPIPAIPNLEPVIQANTVSLLALIYGLNAMGVIMDFHWVRLCQWGMGIPNRRWTDKQGPGNVRMSPFNFAIAGAHAALVAWLPLMPYPGGAIIGGYYISGARGKHIS